MVGDHAVAVALGEFAHEPSFDEVAVHRQSDGLAGGIGEGHTEAPACLLYTSDAADERSSVDLGGRRIITKKKTEKKQQYNFFG